MIVRGEPAKVIIYCDCRNRGGVLTFTQNLRDVLISLNWQCVLITHKPDDTNQQAILDDLLRGFVSHFFISRHTELKKTALEIANVVDSQEVEFYFPNYRAHAFAACALLRNKKTRSIGVCHNDAEDSYSILSQYQGVLSGFICPAKSSFRKLKERIPKRINDIFFIPHYVVLGEEVARPGDREGELRLVYHGRIDFKQKQVDLFLELMERLHEKGVAANLTVIGTGEDETSFREAVIDRGLGKVIFLRSALPWEELLMELPKYDAAVLLSRYEGFCYSLAEAMGTGLPAIAFRAGGVIETYVEDGKNGYLFDNDDLDSMVKVLSKLKNNRPHLQELSENARATALDKLSMNAYRVRMEEFLRFFSESEKDVTRSWHPWRPVYVDGSSPKLVKIWQGLGSLLGLW